MYAIVCSQICGCYHLYGVCESVLCVLVFYPCVCVWAYLCAYIIISVLLFVCICMYKCMYAYLHVFFCVRNYNSVYSFFMCVYVYATQFMNYIYSYFQNKEVTRKCSNCVVQKIAFYWARLGVRSGRDAHIRWRNGRKGETGEVQRHETKNRKIKNNSKETPDNGKTEFLLNHCFLFYPWTCPHQSN